jgi:hypothetical protein
MLELAIDSAYVTAIGALDALGGSAIDRWEW